MMDKLISNINDHSWIIISKNERAEFFLQGFNLVIPNEIVKYLLERTISSKLIFAIISQYQEQQRFSP